MSKGKNNNEDVIAYYIAEGANVSSEPTILKTTKNIIKFEAILQDFGVKNRNGRIYEKEVLQEAWKSPKVVEKLARGGLLQESNHPNSKDINRLSDIDKERVCTVIKEYRFENNLLYGIIETVNCPLGNTIKNLITENNFRISYSLRAFGRLSTKPGRQNIVESPLNLITYDEVDTPSHKASIMTKLIEGEQIIPITEQEATDFLLENSDVMNYLQTYLKDRQKKETNIDINGNVTIFTEQEKLFVNVEKHVRDKYFKML